MGTDALLLAIRAGFEFGTELLRFFQTDRGGLVLQRWMDDRKAFEDGVKQIISSIEKSLGRLRIP